MKFVMLVQTDVKLWKLVMSLIVMPVSNIEYSAVSSVVGGAWGGKVAAGGSCEGQHIDNPILSTHADMFYVAGPCLWNSLPVTLHDRDISLVQFKRLLKTLLFV